MIEYCRTRVWRRGLWPMVGGLLLFASGCGARTAASPVAAGKGAPAVAERTTLAPPSVGGGNTEEFAQLVATVGGQTRLRVDLSTSRVTDEDLAKMEFPDTVTEIDLAHTKVTDQCLASLARARNLEVLGLMGTRVTEAGLPTIKQMPSLCEVRLDNTAVSPESQLDLVRFLAPRQQSRLQRRLTAAGKN